jgi:LysR family transcriptional regulator, glycine cleavage system transcriptional activator
MTRMPPLNALRAFEAVARLGSMKEAANELSVTPGAISQQVAVLEQRLGVLLFHRRDRALVLTEAGRAYFPPVRSAFRQIAEATRRVNSASGAPVLTVSAPPAFAAVWLVPRLGAFQARHPTIDVRLSTSRALADLDAGGTDIAIRHGQGRWKGLRADRIVTAALVPVCNPALLRGGPPPSRAEELASLPLLHDGQRQDWPLWFQAHDVQPVPREAFSGASFDDQMLLLRAAAAGQGVALVTEALARPELAAGVLARALDLPLPQDSAYWLVCPLAAAEQPKIAAFRDWVLAEGAADQAADPVTAPGGT